MENSNGLESISR